MSRGPANRTVCSSCRELCWSSALLDLVSSCSPPFIYLLPPVPQPLLLPLSSAVSSHSSASRHSPCRLPVRKRWGGAKCPVQRFQRMGAAAYKRTLSPAEFITLASNIVPHMGCCRLLRYMYRSTTECMQVASPAQTQRIAQAQKRNAYSYARFSTNSTINLGNHKCRRQLKTEADDCAFPFLLIPATASLSFRLLRLLFPELFVHFQADFLTVNPPLFPLSDPPFLALSTICLLFFFPFS